MILENTFLKSNRLLTKNDFQNLRSDSRFLVSGIFVFYIKKNLHDCSRLGIAVSKKFGKACKRNKLKRKIRENFRKSSFINGNDDVLVSINFKAIKKNNFSPEDCYKLVDSSLKEVFN